MSSKPKKEWKIPAMIDFARVPSESGGFILVPVDPMGADAIPVSMAGLKGVLKQPAPSASIDQRHASEPARAPGEDIGD